MATKEHKERKDEEEACPLARFSVDGDFGSSQFKQNSKA
jgi:hypothetical protein